MPKDQKSGKMPHPDPLMDGVSPFINDWLETMRTKLSVNADWYPIEQERMAYVFDQCGTEAKPYIRVRRNPKHAIAYITAEEMFNTLEKTFSRPKEDREQEASDEYYRLYQGSRPFIQFWADFLWLATELELEEQQILKDLRCKISTTLKNHLITHNFRTVQEIANKCTIWKGRLKVVQPKTKDEKGKKTLRGYANYRPTLGGKAIISGTGIKEIITTTSTTETKGRDTTPKPTYKDLKKQQQSREGKYFVCDKIRHLSYNCPDRKDQIKLNAVKPGHIEEIPSDSEKD